MKPLLQVEGLVRDYRLPRRSLLGPVPRRRALFGVDLELAAGRSLGVVGESGCGKSTLARAVVALEPPTRGRVRFKGQDLFALRPQALRLLRRHFQMVFQDPYGSLDPRYRVGRSVAEPLDALEGEDSGTRRERIAEALDAVGLKAADAGKYPHEFSGGQRQRIAIARALILKPRVIVLDEPTSALDRSVQKQIIELLRDLQETHGLSYIFISHDLAVVRALADEVLVMKEGRPVEQGPTEAIFEAPREPYTRALMAAAFDLAPVEGT